MTTRPCMTCQGFGQLITDPCYECSGDGRVRTRRTLTLKVPAGVDTGTRIQLTGEGEVGHGAGPAGDLYVEVAVNRHPTFQRRGDDLHATIEVPMTAAALGATLAMETFDGPRDLDVRRGTQSGDTDHPARARRHAPARHRPRRRRRAHDGADPDQARRRAGGPAAPARHARAARSAPRAGSPTPPRARSSASCATPSRPDDPSAAPPRPRGPRGSRRRRRRRARRAGGPARRHRAAHPGGRAPAAHRRRRAARRGRGRRGRVGHARPAGGLGVERPRAAARGSCSCRRWPRTTATTRRSRPPPSAGSTRSCRGRPSRSVVQWRGERGEKARRKWDAVLVAATKQSRRTRRPVLGAHGRAPPTSPRGCAARHPPSCCTRTPPLPLAGVTLPDAGDVLLVVGPEGGISPEELDGADRRRRRGGAAGQHRAALVERRAGRAGGAQRRRHAGADRSSSVGQVALREPQVVGVLAHHDGEALEHRERLLAPVGGEHGGAHPGQVGVGDAQEQVGEAAAALAGAGPRPRRTTAGRRGSGPSRRHRHPWCRWVAPRAGGTGSGSSLSIRPTQMSSAKTRWRIGLDERPLALDPLVQQRLGHGRGVGDRVVPQPVHDRPGGAHVVGRAHLADQHPLGVAAVELGRSRRPRRRRRRRPPGPRPRARTGARRRPARPRCAGRVTSESRIGGPGQVDLAQRGAGQVDPAEGGAAEGVGVLVVLGVGVVLGRHPGIVAETSDGRCV